MVGGGVLLECLDDPRVESLVVVGRRSCGVRRARVAEVLVEDLSDDRALRPHFSGVDACFFCLGVSSLGMSEAAYTRVTRDLTLAAARSLLDAGSRPVFCYVSGAGTDAEGRAMWARVKGRTENALRALPFPAAYMFRPAYIQPVRGVRSKTGWYQALYSLFGFSYPLLRRAFPSHVTSTAVLGRAMIRAASERPPGSIL